MGVVMTPTFVIYDTHKRKGKASAVVVAAQAIIIRSAGEKKYAHVVHSTDRSPLHDVHLSGQMHDLDLSGQIHSCSRVNLVAHVTGWEPYDLHDLECMNLLGWICTTHILHNI